ncbi:hypothetical protein DFQ27_000024 [Actinomortierella ambigua]|uniref:SEC7 domain-containing protein n=1 Tax=Actinomortierella ambigua TaxID=1343610 RepID=A0A9P6QM62_9FUNG|nr:hypothetical protein DFQ27_000024 [Actinomortierella ambigua]
MPGSSLKAAGAPQSRRRQSAGVFPSATFDLIERSTPPAATATATSGPSSSSHHNPPPPAASASYGSSLKPPLATTGESNHRHSFGMWGGSKAAASTPNLASSSSTLRPSDASLNIGSSSNSVHGGHTSYSGGGGGGPGGGGDGGGPGGVRGGVGVGVGLSAGGGEGVDGGSTGISGALSSVSNASSFQQRRKRSESIGNIKNTAGSFGRMVRKSSSNFLKKLAKTFDDKDAPPTPVVPPLPTNAAATITPPPPAARTVTMTMQGGSLVVGIGSNSQQNTTTTTSDTPLAPSSPSEGKPPLTIQPISLGQDPDRGPPSPSTIDRELSASVANVENWLRSTSELAEGEELDEPIEPKTPTTPRKMNPESFVCVSDADAAAADADALAHSIATTDDGTEDKDHQRDPNGDDDDEEDEGDDDDGGDDDDDVDDDIPLAALSISANRLSKLYESGSLRLNQSQTSLYYSVQSNMSAADELDLRRSSYTTFHSYRNSQYSVMTNRESAASGGVPSASASSATLDVFEKPLPRRPISMFVPQTTASALSADDGDEDDSTVVHNTNNNNGSSGKEQLDSEEIHILQVNVAADKKAQTTTDDEQQQSKADATEKTTAGTGPGGEVAATTSTAPATAVSRSGSGSQLLTPSNTTMLGHDLSWRPSNGGRPMTIYIDSTGAAATGVETARPQPGSGAQPAAAQPTELSPEAQREAMHDLAKRNSKRCYEEDETFLHKDEISGYLGSAKQLNKLVLVYYMDFFNFSNLRLDAAFRTLCNKLVLRGETQEVDRILEAFARRYVTCNPRSIFGSKDIVHAITYSILLLNTDLHVVQQSSKMSRSAFVKNTLQVVQAQIQQQSDGASDMDPRSSEGRDDGSALGVYPPISGSGSGGPSSGKRRPPSVKSWKSGHSQQSTTRLGADPKANGGHGNGKQWLNELESYLKDIYSSVKHNQILLPITPSTPTSIHSSSTLSNQNTPPGQKISGSPIGGLLARSRLLQSSNNSNNTSNGSIDLSAGIGNPNYGSGGSSGPGRRNSVASKQKQQLRMEALQRLADQSNLQHSSGNAGPPPQIPHHLLPDPVGLSSSPRLSILGFSDPNLVAATIGTMELRKTAQSATGSGSGESRDTSILDRRLGPGSNIQRLSMLTPTSTPQQQQQQQQHQQVPHAPKSPALSAYSRMSATTPKLQLDASYQLYAEDGSTPLPTPGATGQNAHMLPPPTSSSRSANKREPGYRMEGIMYRKHLLERADKKAQNRAWKKLLVVLDNGGLSMFRADAPISYPVLIEDYGAAQDALFHEIRLQHTITNMLPPPGYSASRRHVFAIQLFSGAVYLFQVGSAEECEDWVQTCNYWAAKTSKEPLAGGVINMDYGWGRSLDMMLASEAVTSPVSPGFQGLQLSGISTGTDSGMASANTSSTHLGLSGGGSSSATATPATMSSISVGQNDDAASLHGSIHRSADDNKSLKSLSGSIHGSGIGGGISSLSSSVPPPVPVPDNNNNSSTSGYFKRGAGISSSATNTAATGSNMPSNSSSSRSLHKEAGTISPPNSGSAAGFHSTSAPSSSLSLSMMGDRAALFDWTAPTPSMAMSQLDEEAQLDALKRYLASLEAEMEVHQEHRGPMMRLFNPKSNNFTKAFNNWEKRSRYLLKEMVKYQVYIECLERSLEQQIIETHRLHAAQAEYMAAAAATAAAATDNAAGAEQNPSSATPPFEENIQTSS